MAFNRFASRDDSKAFVKEVRGLTDGEGMHIICDMLRGPVFAAGFAATARQGVIVSAGWQLARSVDYNSAAASIKQLTLDHTHFETLYGVEAATELYGSVFKPTIHKEIYAFEDLPRAMMEMHEATQTGIPIIRIAKEMPESVASLIP
jgi:NADPH:quinone reductase-like Zn-dependent oxidoreductase